MEEATTQEPEEFVPTKAEDYPVDREEQLVLPSGAKVIVKRPSKYVMLMTGGFPKQVESAIREALAEQREPELETRLRAMNHILCAAFVSPKLHITPKKDCLAIADLPDPDREYIIALLGLSVF